MMSMVDFGLIAVNRAAENERYAAKSEGGGLLG
jgi:hypothetical protein